MDKAASHDATKARVLCADMKAGEIMVADKAYVDFKLLMSLIKRVFFGFAERKRTWLMK